jgi:hypothetical protein
VANPKAVSFEIAKDPLQEGTPTGNIVFIALPEATFIALNDAAAKRGMNVAQLLAQAIGVVLKSPQE